MFWLKLRLRNTDSADLFTKKVKPKISYEARAEFCQIFRSFGQWSFEKKCFWYLLTFTDRQNITQLSAMFCLYLISLSKKFWFHLFMWRKLIFTTVTYVIMIKGNTYKGQLISEWLFDVLNFPKANAKIWWISALGSRNWLNWKNEIKSSQIGQKFIKFLR